MELTTLGLDLNGEAAPDVITLLNFHQLTGNAPTNPINLQYDQRPSSQEEPVSSGKHDHRRHTDRNGTVGQERETRWPDTQKPRCALKMEYLVKSRLKDNVLRR